MINSHDSRDESKALIDKLPQSDLEHARVPVSPLSPDPQIKRSQQRQLQYQRRVKERFRKPGKARTLGGGGQGGGAFASMQGGVAVERYHFGYWDGKAFVDHEVQSFDGQEIKIMERFSVFPDRTKLLCKPGAFMWRTFDNPWR